MISPLSFLLVALGLAGLRRGALATTATQPQRVPVISGACMLVRRDVWEQLGGLDPKFVLYAEEVDLCKRIAECGLELWADPSITMIHDSGSGDPYCPVRRTRLLKGNATFLRKHHGPVAAAIGCGAMYLNELLRAALAPIVALRNRAHAEGLRRRSSPQIAGWRRWWNGWALGEAL